MFSKELNAKLDKYHLLNHPFYRSWNDGKLTREIIKCSPFDSLLIHFETQNTTLDRLIHTH